MLYRGGRKFEASVRDCQNETSLLHLSRMRFEQPGRWPPNHSPHVHAQSGCMRGRPYQTTQQLAREALHVKVNFSSSQNVPGSSASKTAMIMVGKLPQARTVVQGSSRGLLLSSKNGKAWSEASRIGKFCKTCGGRG